MVSQTRIGVAAPESAAFIEAPGWPAWGARC